MKRFELITIFDTVTYYKNNANCLIVRYQDEIPPYIELLLQLIAYKHGLEILKYNYGQAFDSIDKKHTDLYGPPMEDSYEGR